MTGGQPMARTTGTGPEVRPAAGRKGFKAELDRLRERMRGLGFSCDEIAAEVARRYRVRPREAYRLALGWTPEYAAERFKYPQSCGETGIHQATAMTPR